MTTTDLRPPTTDRCPQCRHPWISHNPPGAARLPGFPVEGCDAWADPDAAPRDKRRCGCLEGPPPAAPDEMIPRPVKRLGLAADPLDTLAALQEMYDQLRPLLDFVGAGLTRDDLLSAAAAVRHGGTKVYLATAQDTHSGEREVVGVSTSAEGARAYLGSLWLRDTGEKINPRIDTLELDDPEGLVTS